MVIYDNEEIVGNYDNAWWKQKELEEVYMVLYLFQGKN